MRQLDLFGSFSETSPDKEPVEQVAVFKKEESQTSDVRRPSYSKNLLRSERLVQDAVTDKDGTTPVTLDKSIEIFNSSASIPPKSLLSLFDASATVEDEATTVRNIDLPVEIIDETGFAAEQSEQISVVESFEKIISEDIKSSTAEDGLENLEEESRSTALLEERKTVGTTKTKKQSLPELQRIGAVIFDDGKITVKIKNKSPFPAPITNEKKEKVKKVPQKRGRKSFREIDAEVDLIEIPEDEILFKKQYYPISEVAKWFRVNTSLLRFWENEFDVLKPRKNRKGDRLFRPEDVKNLQLIYQLLRQKKYTIEGAKEYIKTNKRKADIQLQLTNTLQKFRSFLLDLKTNLSP
jgi:DNA-binding transcriptional MerR regulator